LNVSIATLPPSPRKDETPATPAPPRWRPRSIVLIVLFWLVLYIGGLFTPGLLDDVDSIYLEIAREMLQRHDYVTPYIDGIRFFDKPPLMYWLAAGSMRLFGQHDWAGRLPLALLTLALLLATYALALRLFPSGESDRAALYSALALATSVGPYLYTRFYIPDIPVALFLTLAIHAFLTALDRIRTQRPRAEELVSVKADELVSLKNDAVIPSEAAQRRSRGTPAFKSFVQGGPFMERPSGRDMSGVEQSPSPLLPCLTFAAVTALNVLSKGFIGLVFPLGFVFLYLAFTRHLRLLLKFHPIPSTLTFLTIAAPWHVLAALRNPAIAMPAGLGLPARAGWTWFYLYNEHIARFLSRRIPHDYGQVPIPLFWLLTAIWIFPWLPFVLGAVRSHLRDLRHEMGAPFMERPSGRDMGGVGSDGTASLTLLLWSGLVLGFFTLSARQEYYALPCLPALALMAGGLLAAANRSQPWHDASMRDDIAHHKMPSSRAERSEVEGPPHLSSPTPGAQFMAQSYRDMSGESALFWHRWLLVPIGSLAAAIALFFAITAPHVDPNTDIASLLIQGGGDYNLSLSHLFDLTGRAMGLFRIPLLCFGISMAAIGPGTYLLRRRAYTHAANLTLAAAAASLLLCMHTGLVGFYPTLGSKPLAEAILAEQATHPLPNDLILIDGELTSGSSLLFYTRQPAHLINGHINGPWFGSFWPDAPHLFETDDSLHHQWSGHRRLFLLTYHANTRAPELARFGPVHILASSGGKTILINQP